MQWRNEVIPDRRYCASGPLVRSSYRAGEFFTEAMIKSDREKLEKANQVLERLP